jgi:hypothetical protein
VVQCLCDSDAPNWSEEDRTVARRRHTPEQIIRKLAEGSRLLAGGSELDEAMHTIVGSMRDDLERHDLTFHIHSRFDQPIEPLAVVPLRVVEAVTDGVLQLEVVHA